MKILQIRQLWRALAAVRSPLAYFVCLGHAAMLKKPRLMLGVWLPYRLRWADGRLVKLDGWMPPALVASTSA